MRQWEVALRTGGSTAPHAETHVLANLDCGTVAVESTPANRSAREATELWFLGLHYGTAGGRAGEIFISILGLAPLILFWSGVRTWLRRRAVTINAARSRSLGRA